MKKYLTLLIALAITSSFTFAEDGVRPERPKRPTLAEQIERIGSLLEDVDLSDRKRAYLEGRKAVLDIQSEFRAAVKSKMLELGDDVTRDVRHDAMKGLREDFTTAMDSLKDTRRGMFDRRRQLREGAADGEE
jgi:hypothetical protein